MPGTEVQNLHVFSLSPSRGWGKHQNCPFADKETKPELPPSHAQIIFGYLLFIQLAPWNWSFCSKFLENVWHVGTCNKHRVNKWIMSFHSSEPFIFYCPGYKILTKLLQSIFPNQLWATSFDLPRGSSYCGSLSVSQLQCLVLTTRRLNIWFFLPGISPFPFITYFSPIRLSRNSLNITFLERALLVSWCLDFFLCLSNQLLYYGYLTIFLNYIMCLLLYLMNPSHTGLLAL